jgi:pimeloyl-ACP methyl ester carboxylesterase
MVIDLGDGVKTRAQLTLPAVGNGPFPGVLLIHGSGNTDMNETSGKTFWEISEYLSERGFAVLRYDKRGIGEGGTIINTSIWGNMTINDLIEDSKKALNVLMQQPEVDPKRISLIGYSEGTIIAPRVALSNPTAIENVVLMAPVAQNLFDLINFHMIDLPILYAKEVLDKNNTGGIPISAMVKDNFLKYELLTTQFPEQNDSQSVTSSLLKLFNKSNASNNVSIENQIRPILVESFNNSTNSNSTDCIGDCRAKWWQSHRSLSPTLKIIGNISSSIDILMLIGENDANTPKCPSYSWLWGK